MKLESLLWELASPVRMRLLKILQAGGRKLTRIAWEAGLSAQEAHRNLSRLLEVGLVAKNEKGFYMLTPAGEYVLVLLEPLGVFAEHWEYFAGHSLAHIPRSLVYRLAELRGSREAPDPLTALGYAELLVREAEEYIWIITEQILPGAARAMSGKEVHVRLLIPEVEPPPGIEDVKVPGLRVRHIRSVPAALIINEKRAALALPRHSGEIDYRGLLVESPQGHRWCRDLFLYFWETAHE